MGWFAIIFTAGMSARRVLRVVISPRTIVDIVTSMTFPAGPFSKSQHTLAQLLALGTAKRYDHPDAISI